MQVVQNQTGLHPRVSLEHVVTERRGQRTNQRRCFRELRNVGWGELEPAAIDAHTYILRVSRSPSATIRDLHVLTDGRRSDFHCTSRGCGRARFADLLPDAEHWQGTVRVRPTPLLSVLLLLIVHTTTTSTSDARHRPSPSLLAHCYATCHIQCTPVAWLVDLWALS